ncbi:MAG: polysaccharide deacetylase family protein [Candidatus Velamenicoccus archaeovorus]
MSLDRSRIGLRAAILLGVLVVPLAVSVALGDLPPPLHVVVNGEPVLLAHDTTFGNAVRELHLHARSGRLLDVQGGVLDPRADPGAILLNGDQARRSTALGDGDRIQVVNGTDRTEGTRRVVERLPGVRPGNPQYSLATSRVERITVTGRISGEVVRIRYRSLGEARMPPAVALTFDDGPWPGGTRRILAILERMHVKATFFVIGYLVERYPAIVRDLVEAGMEIGNHSWDHVERPPFARLRPHRVQTELAMTSDLLERRFGVRPRLFRPPGGSWDPKVLAAAQQLGMRIALWDVDPRDWSPSATPRSIVDAVLARVKPGAVVDLHDGGGDPWATIRALPRIVRGIRKMGLRLVPMGRAVRAAKLPRP